MSELDEARREVGMDTRTFQNVGAISHRRVAEAYQGAVIVIVAFAAAALLLIGVMGARAAAPQGSPLPAPQPLVAPVAAAADYPEQSRIASCWVLANQSSALLAPRSDRSSEIVGPIYADACLDAA
jgi:hypothetical protein